jgi:hypothetical protein
MLLTPPVIPTLHMKKFRGEIPEKAVRDLTESFS